MSAVGIILITFYSYLYTVSINAITISPPVMGYITENNTKCQTDCSRYPTRCVSEQNVKRIAQKLVTTGLRDVGYRLIVVDACWYKRKIFDTVDTIRYELPNFPSGFHNLTEHLHELGLQFGLSYDNMCYNEQQFAAELKQIKQWNLDYIKITGCLTDDLETVKGYSRMKDLTMKMGIKMTIACDTRGLEDIKLLEWENAEPFDVLNGCDSWRLPIIKEDLWSRKRDDGWRYRANLLTSIRGNGFWFDMGPIPTTEEMKQQRYRLLAYSISSSPMLMKGNLDELSQSPLDILKNPRLIAINQDVGRLLPVKLGEKKAIPFWSREIASEPNTWVISFLNPNSTHQYVLGIKLYQFHIERVHDTNFFYTMTKVLTGEKHGPYTLWEQIDLTLEPEEPAMYLVKHDS